MSTLNLIQGRLEKPRPERESHLLRQLKKIMKYPKQIFSGLLCALGITVYVAGVSLLLRNGERWFGKMDNFLGPTALLLLFVLSAAVTGALALGRSVWLYLENRKNEAVRLFLYIIGWLAVITTLIITALA